MFADPIPDDKTSVPAKDAVNLFSASDVLAILRERGWIEGEPSDLQAAWCTRAAALLGLQASDRTALAGLVGLVFEYDAPAILQTTEAHVVLSRYAARDVLRQLALLLLDGVVLTTEHFNEVITALKEETGLRSRELFHPLRLAIAGRNGEGELDRVVLLLDEAAAAGFGYPVKTARARILEFCGALD